MKRTTILADENLLAEVSAVARRRGVTTSHAVREALERYVADDQAQERPLPDLVGMFEWEGEPTGERAEETLERDWPAELNSRQPAAAPERGG
jgi:metal-responsive CopG/Arc/MetJ family transcriptional regulator